MICCFLFSLPFLVLIRLMINFGKGGVLMYAVGENFVFSWDIIVQKMSFNGILNSGLLNIQQELKLE